MRKRLSIILISIGFINSQINAQQLRFEVLKYDIFLDYYKPNDGALSDTFHYDSNLLLTDDFSIYEYVSGNHYPILKGKFKEGKLIDSLFTFQNDGHLFIRGYFAESNLPDTFSYSLNEGYSVKFSFPGVKSGKFTYYNPWTDEMARSENFVNGKPDGDDIYYENGFITGRFHYENGLQNGKSYTYFPKTDIPDKEWNYCNDTLCGIYKAWYTKDTLKEIVEYEKGIHKVIKEFWSKGNLKHLEFFNDSRHQDSTETEWYMDGQLCYIKTYKNGIQNGKYEEYYPSGQLKNKIYLSK